MLRLTRLSLNLHMKDLQVQSLQIWQGLDLPLAAGQHHILWDQLSHGCFPEHLTSLWLSKWGGAHPFPQSPMWPMSMSWFILFADQFKLYHLSHRPTVWACPTFLFQVWGLALPPLLLSHSHLCTTSLQLRLWGHLCVFNYWQLNLLCKFRRMHLSHWKRCRVQFWG